MLAKKLNQRSKTLTTNQLSRIERTTASRTGSGTMTNRAREYLYFFIACVRLGYEQIEAPISAIALQQNRAGGRTRSVSTAQRAIRELEQLGFLSRSQYRPRSLSTIFFHLDKFVFWTQRSEKNIVPLPTPPHNFSHRSSCAPLDPTRDLEDHAYKSKQDLCLETKSKDHANKIKNGDNRTAKPAWQHPIFLTLWVVIQGLFDGKKIYSLAIADRQSETVQIVNWEKWTKKRWTEMLFAEREHVARTEIVPALRAQKSTKTSDDSSKINKIVKKLSGDESQKKSNSKSEWARDIAVERDKLRDKTDLSDKDLEILLAAKKKIEKSY